jgi:DNA mismatch repair ATPase MutS
MTYGQRIIPFFAGFSQVHGLLTVASQFAELPNVHALPELGFLRGASAIIERVRQRLRWLVTDRTSAPELVQAVFGYLNMFFLLDVVIFLRSVSALRENQKTLAAVMESVGAIDATISVASYIESLPVSCVPTFSTQRHFEVSGLCHPLIAAPVSNAFTLIERSALIAGPNMAGKTSFVRTIGINLILAQTLNFCLARDAILPRVVVRSAIRREDNLSDGESYFFSEIKQILEFIRVEKSASFHVFLIDEIFRGTNTIERIAGSVAVLRHLAREHMVVVTTHDAKLQELLADTFDMHHFTDLVAEGKYGFDYLIRPGPVRSRNAIKLLELTGYPKSITCEAERLADELSGAA